MSKSALLYLILILVTPFSIDTGMASFVEQLEQGEIFFDSQNKLRCQYSIPVLRTPERKIRKTKGLFKAKLTFDVSTRSAEARPPIYLQYCVLLI
jgi:hypothetical protein